MNRRGFLARLALVGVALAAPALVPSPPADVAWQDVAGADGVSYRALAVGGFLVFASPYVRPDLGVEMDGRIYLHPSKFSELARLAS